LKSLTVTAKRAPLVCRAADQDHVVEVDVWRAVKL
jgi:hypothetical protein